MNLVLDKSVRNDEYIDSMFDQAFKSIVQNPKFRRLLSLIISEVTNFSPRFIYDNLNFINTELPIDKINERVKITDILAYVDGSIINIEANKSISSSMIGKNNLYHHKIAYQKYKKGENIDNNMIIQINFNTVRRFGDKLFEEFIMRNKDCTFIDEENFKRIHINMANPLEKYYTNSELTKVEKILVMFQITNKKELWKLAKGDEDLENMARIIDDLNEDDEIIGAYYKDEMDEWMKKVDHEEAIKEGQAKGFKQGIEQGIEKGHNEGSKEKALEIAKKLVKIGLDKKEISQVTGLSLEEINLFKD